MFMKESSVALNDSRPELVNKYSGAWREGKTADGLKFFVLRTGEFNAVSTRSSCTGLVVTADGWMIEGLTYRPNEFVYLENADELMQRENLGILVGHVHDDAMKYAEECAESGILPRAVNMSVGELQIKTDTVMTVEHGSNRWRELVSEVSRKVV